MIAPTGRDVHVHPGGGRSARWEGRALGGPDRLQALLAAAAEELAHDAAARRRIVRGTEAALGEPLARTAALAAEMWAACAARGWRVAGDGSVSEADAAALLGRRPSTLRGWRGMGRPIPFTKARRTGRITYRIADLAAYRARDPEFR